MIDRACAFRLAHPTFPLDIAKAGLLNANAPMEDFVHSVGTPLLRNNKDEVFLLDPSSPIAPANYS